MGLNIWVAIWKKFSANSIRDKREKQAPQFATTQNVLDILWSTDIRFSTVTVSCSTLFTAMGWDGYRTPFRSSAWKMPIRRRKSNNYSIGLVVFESACSPVSVTKRSETVGLIITLQMSDAVLRPGVSPALGLWMLDRWGSQAREVGVLQPRAGTSALMPIGHGILRRFSHPSQPQFPTP